MERENKNPSSNETSRPFPDLSRLSTSNAKYPSVINPKVMKSPNFSVRQIDFYSNSNKIGKKQPELEMEAGSIMNDFIEEVQRSNEGSNKTKALPAEEKWAIFCKHFDDNKKAFGGGCSTFVDCALNHSTGKKAKEVASQPPLLVLLSAHVNDLKKLGSKERASYGSLFTQMPESAYEVVHKLIKPQFECMVNFAEVSVLRINGGWIDSCVFSDVVHL